MILTAGCKEEFTCRAIGVYRTNFEQDLVMMGIVILMTIPSLMMS